MGGKNSVPEAQKLEGAIDKKIDKQQRQDMLQAAQKVKLLLLGAGESGKSALFKQVRALYGHPLTDNELSHFRETIHRNVHELVLVLCNAVVEFGTEGDIHDKELFHAFLSESFQALGQSIGDHTFASAIPALWSEPAIQAAWTRRSDLQIVESHHLFLDQLDRIFATDYIPTVADTVLARVRSTGVVCNEFQIEGSTLTMVDVGGQRNERRKWIHCFDNVDAIVFVVALSEYDMSCFEDNTTNRMQEALELFKWISEHEAFMKTDMILFLNKSDLFRAKLPNVPINSVELWSDYDGGDDFDAGCAYFRNEFKAQIGNDDTELYCHVTCATDPDNVENVFRDCQDLITRENLENAGLL